jgi:hypothetical protein
VIVVFCEVNILVPDPIPSTFDPTERATYLDRFFVEISNPASEGNDSVATAYKVSVNTGPFMNVTSPVLPIEGQGTSNTVAVFAMIADDENRLARSLQRAKDGIKLIMPAQNNLFSSSESEFPANMSPPGLRWLVFMPSLPGGQSMTWKMRSGKHRNDEFTVPPNHMVQCYALGPSYSDASFGGGTFTGYQIHGYRLDRKGTGQIYGEKLPGEEGPRQNIDPAWNVTISDVSTDTLGIPFRDPPPLISADLITPPVA